jgi:hypothetical protein
MPSKKAIAKLKKDCSVTIELWIIDPMNADRMVMSSPPACPNLLRQLYHDMRKDYPPLFDGPRLAVMKALRYEVDPETGEPKEE